MIKKYDKFKSRPGNNEKIKALITKHKSLLTNSEYKYVSYNYFETSNFYGHFKTHKSKFLHKAVKEHNKELITIWESKDLKLRAIVGEGPKCPTRRLRNFLDRILKPLTKHVKSSIKYNKEFLKTCKRNVTDDTVLLSMYAVYTPVSHMNSD